LLQVLAAEPTPKLRGQIHRQPLHQLFAIPRPALAFLLGLHDTVADFPITCSHQGIDVARDGHPRGLDHGDDATAHVSVVGQCRR
jgi:hypothetical protein